MRVRFAILWDLDDREGIKGDRYAAIPCGLVVDRGDYVQVRMTEGGYGIKERFDEDIPGELGPDLTRPVHKPGEHDYFDRVLSTLFRGFAITMPESAFDLALQEDMAALLTRLFQMDDADLEKLGEAAQYLDTQVGYVLEVNADHRKEPAE